MPPMLLRRRMSRLARSTVKFAGSTFASGSSPVCMLTAPKVTLPAFPSRGYRAQRDRARSSRPMRRVKKRYGVSPALAPTPDAGPARERERAEALEKEVALLGKEQAEPGQVDLLFVDLHLREVGVDGEVGGQALRDAEFHVPAHAPGRVVGQRRRHGPVGGHAREPVRFQFHVAAARRNLQAREGARRRDLENAAEGGERSRHRGEVRPLVLPSDDPPEVDPHVWSAPG